MRTYSKSSSSHGLEGNNTCLSAPWSAGILFLATTVLASHAFIQPSPFSLRPCTLSTASSLPGTTVAPSASCPPGPKRRDALSSLRLQEMDMDAGGPSAGSDLSILNQVMLVGRLGSEPAVKYLESGNCVLSISMAVNRETSPGRQNMEAVPKAPEVDWVRLEAWGRTAEGMAANTRKGSRVWVVGRLVTNSWVDRYGQNRNDLKVRIRRIEVLQSGRSQTQPPMGGEYYQQGGGWDGKGAGGREEQSSMVMPDYLASGMDGGQEQSPYSRNGAGAPSPVASPFTKKGSYGHGGGTGGGGQFEVDEYEADTDIPF